MQHSGNREPRNDTEMWHFSHRFVMPTSGRRTTNPSSAIAAGCALALLWVSPARAEPVAKPLAALQQCRTVVDTQARLACYDKTADALLAATASGETVVIEREQLRSARKGLFGFSFPRIGFLDGNGSNGQPAPETTRLETKLTGVRSLGYGKWRFTIDGGALWETTETYQGFDDPAPGAAMVIEKGALGSYYAKIGKERRVQVRRIG